LKDPVAHVYEAWADRYDSESKWNPAIQMEENSLVPLLSPSKRDVILEIGCGTGRLTRPIARKCKTITGIDFSERMLSVAKKRSRRLANIRYMAVDAEKRLPFRNASFDKVLAALVLNHVDKIGELFAEVHRVLKKDGVFVFDDCVPDAEYFEESSSNPLSQTYRQGRSVFSEHTIDQYVNCLHRANFDIEVIKFPRFDESIKHLVTAETFERNKGRTFGVIILAKKP